MSQLQVAQAVAASAAFPVGLTPVTLTNYSPCALQETSEGEFLISRIRDDQLESTYGNGDIPGQSTTDVVFIDANNNLPRRSQGLREGRLLNRDRRKDYVHLLDGGIADNLGLAEPLDLVTGGAGRDGAPPEGIRHYVFVVVNARSDATTDRDLSPATPGIPAMALSSINAAIDGRTFGLQAQLSVLPAVLNEGRDGCAGDAAGSGCQAVEVVSIDFELIREPECRQAFANIGTNWALHDRVVDSLMEMGSAMVLASPHFRQLARRAGSEIDTTDDALAAAAQARARQACTRLLDPDATLPPVRFGPEGS
jgi:NTE family protein